MIPRFEQDEYEEVVSEDVTVGVEIISVRANDEEGGLNGDFV